MPYAAVLAGFYYQNCKKYSDKYLYRHGHDNWMLTYMCCDESETLFIVFSQETTTSLTLSISATYKDNYDNNDNSPFNALLSRTSW